MLTPINKQPPLKFWNFIDSSGDEADLYIYGVITNGDGWIYELFGIEATDQVQFIKDLNALGKKKIINTYINSPGGDVYAAHTIHNVLARNPAKIIHNIDGIAASAATIIPMSGYVRMQVNSQMMIHDPLIGLEGYFNAADLAEMGDTLAQVKASIVAAYASKANISEKEIIKLMSKSVHLTAKQAVDMGFADEILYDKPVEIVNSGRFLIVNSLAFDTSKFQFNPYEPNERNDDIVNNQSTQTVQTAAPVVQAAIPQDARHLEGGVLAWVESVDPSLPTY
jgi:ATP-dependent protease ClpP protease subunit